MLKRTHRRPETLGQVEQAVMNHVWAHGPVSAEQCRDAVRPSRPMKESTMRTVLRRLEDKGYVTHAIQGRTYIYTAVETPTTVAARAVQRIIDRFCAGSADALVVGMVDNAMLSAADLERLARAIGRRKAGRR